jgi:hypothetical protein
VHRPGGVPDAGGEEAEQGRRRVPRQHPVAEELLAPGLTAILLATRSIIFYYSRISLLPFRVTKCVTTVLSLSLSLSLCVPCRVCVRRGSSCQPPPVVKPKKSHRSLTALLQTCILSSFPATSLERARVSVRVTIM